jgi:two-component system cell cycle sensor histidine kinase/response regulator CckA
VKADQVAELGSDILPIADYSALSVTDTGCGIPASVLGKIWEPFFTTKEVGKGTGLGLSTVYGIVKQSDGYVGVYSVLGRGTTIKVYLPMVEEDPRRAAAPEARARPLRRGHGTVLIAEDEEAVRTLAARALSELGYETLQAEDGRAALDILIERDGRVDLVITDLIMPRMDGKELGEEIARRYAALPVLYMSGYTDDDALLRGLVAPDAPFVAKPFAPDALASRVQDVLGR